MTIHGNTSGMRINRAFTLSEVLITLGIIGVVAALTLPVIVSNINNKQNISKLKKSYSVLSNTVNFIRNEGIEICSQPLLNTEKYCGGSAASNEFKDRFVELLKPVKLCGCDYESKCSLSVNHTWQGLMQTCNAVGKTIYKDLNNSDISSRNMDSRVMMLNDGSVVYLGYLEYGPWVSVDVNGIKGPNILSKDLFLFILTPNGLLPYGADNTDVLGKDAAFLCEDSESNASFAIAYKSGAGCTAKYLIN